MNARSLYITLMLLMAIGGTAFAAGNDDDSALSEATPGAAVGTAPPQEDEDHEGEDHEGEADEPDFHAHDVIVVTGSAIEEPAVDLPYAVEILNRELQKEQGSLQAVDLMKSLTASSGVIGEANSWYNDQGTAVPENVANVNLRGLGASRTLVLLNGRRQVPLPARLFGGRFVDVNAFPSLAIDRIEVLKEGAAAIYGSDAVAGVANFVTRDEFTGFEVAVSHESMDGAGDSSAGAIWGGKLGGSEHHLVFSLERAERSHLGARERPYTLMPRGGGWFWGWSNTGNPGIFLRPNLTGGEDASAFVNELARARNGAAGTDYFVDPACNGLGGYDRGWTCAFRYQPWDSLIEATETNRFFAELNGPLGDGTTYHVEALVADSVIPNYVTTPSFPPVSLLDGLQVISNDHPGRAEFCNGSFGMGGFASSDDCLTDDWYFYGRLVGNAGPGRGLRRGTDTTRVAANIDHDLTVGGKAANLDVGVSYSRATGNMNHPAEYAYRKFLAFRGYGGPNCGVGVVADETSPSGMRLGNTGSAQPGVGGCMYYNPFGNAIEFSGQPGAPWENSANPMYRAGLENSRDLLDWIFEQVNVENEAELVVADATLSGNWLPGKLDYAFGYQYRNLDVSAIPNAVGNYELNPCVVPGDRSCVDPATGRQRGARAGQFTFTSGYYPYGDSQEVHRAFGELSLNALGATCSSPQLRAPRRDRQFRSEVLGPLAALGRRRSRAVVPHLGPDDVPRTLGRRSERGDSHDPGVPEHGRRVQGGRRLRQPFAAAGAGVHVQPGPGALRPAGNRRHAGLLELRLRRRDRPAAAAGGPAALRRRLRRQPGRAERGDGPGRLPRRRDGRFLQSRRHRAGADRPDQLARDQDLGLRLPPARPHGRGSGGALLRPWTARTRRATS